MLLTSLGILNRFDNFRMNEDSSLSNWSHHPLYTRCYSENDSK